MPRAIYQHIYQTLRDEILSGKLPYQSLLPSEHALTERFDCSRSSVRRALSELAAEGMVQSMQGRGVRVIHNQLRDAGVTVDESGLETFKELCARKSMEPRTEALSIGHVTADERLAKTTGFAPGSELTHIVRLRYADNDPVGIDESYYLAESVPNITREVVENSIYEYLEKDLGFSIVTSRRHMTVEAPGAFDREHLDLGDVDAVVVLRCNAYDSRGIMVEYTETRQVAGFFEVSLTSQRRPAPMAALASA